MHNPFPKNCRQEFEAPFEQQQVTSQMLAYNWGSLIFEIECQDSHQQGIEDSQVFSLIDESTVKLEVHTTLFI